jgi:hypothetical protein
MIHLDSPLGPIALSILKANLANPALTDRFTYRPAPPPPGIGYGITTYMGDGDPLPSFVGDPLPLPCIGDPQQIIDTYWAALDPRNRISLAVKQIPVDDGPSSAIVRNRFD